ncbi:MAG: serine hydrolase domain-containing protein [Planctomycetota bacterium]|jgi:CubicO group peptidase (beta-lactamase class C family)
MKLLRTTIILLTLLLCLSTGCRPGPKEEPKPNFIEIDQVVEEEIEKGNFPGAVVLVGRVDEILYCNAFGHKQVDPCDDPVDKNTIFDLASMTKPIATATSIMILRDRKKIELDDYVSKYLPAFACKGKEQARIEHLLTHTSGLPAYTNAAKLTEQFGNPCPDKVIEKICSLEAASKPGEEFCYSCLGYITLAKIVEIISGKNIGEFSSQNIFRPLDMKQTSYNPPDAWERDIAATEVIDGKPLRGTVHDPLARLMAGLSGNAGLFSNACDLTIYCRMLFNRGALNGKRILSPEAVTLLTAERAHGRACGFDVNSRYAWVKGSYAPEQAYCHTGYTGTSIVCDPASKTFIIILTNRVHPNDGGATKPVRIKISDIVFNPNGGEK